jgi:hypothetical protein
VVKERWITEKMDEFDKRSPVVVLSPTRTSRHKAPKVFDREALIG